MGLWGAVGTVSFIWARRMAQITNFDRETFLIHTLQLKLWLFEVCIGSHSLAMFAKKFLRAREKKFTGARRTLTTLYRRLCILLFGCLLALYGSTTHPARLCGAFRTIFFSATTLTLPFLLRGRWGKYSYSFNLAMYVWMCGKVHP